MKKFQLFAVCNDSIEFFYYGSIRIKMQIRQAESYELLCLAGDGGQAQVFLAEKDNKKFIVKIYFPHNQALTYFSREASILSRLHSNYIIKMVENFPEGKVTLGNQKQVRPMIVLELAEHGDLFKMVNISRLSEDVSRTLFKQLLQAIRALKQAEIGHLDIKLENILLDQNYNLKLTDFGYAKSLMEEPEFLTSWQGTTGYMAPEIHDKKYKAYEVDIFAAGVALFLMIFRMPPFESSLFTNPDYNLIRKGKLEDFWKRIQKRVPASMPLKRMISKIFALDPSIRPSLSQLQNQEWLLGPTLNQEEMKKYMEPRYRRLEKGDEETMNIRKALKEKIKNILMEVEKEDRSRSRNGPSRFSHEQETLLQELSHHNLSSCEVKEHKFSCFYAETSPQMVLLWLHQFLSQKKKEGKEGSIFIDSADTAEFYSFGLEINSKGIIELNMEFCLANKNYNWTTDVKLEGKFATWEDKYALVWNKREGCDFWASQIKAKLEEEFQLMFE